jgi:cytochrome c-type biogenesis protein CcmH/NrfF
MRKEIYQIRSLLKSGESAVDILQDSVERWGDYTGIQRKFNEPNTAWISGSLHAYKIKFGALG